MRKPLRTVVTTAFLAFLGCTPSQSLEGEFANAEFGTIHFQRRGELEYEVGGLTIPGAKEDDQEGVYSIFILWAQRKGEKNSMGSDSVMEIANRIALRLDGGKVVRGSYLNSAGEGRVRLTVSGDEARTGGGIVFLRRK